MVAGIAAMGAEFWELKDPDAWTEKEVARLRTNSPWARKEVQEAPAMEARQVTKHSGKTVKTTTKQKKVWGHAADVQVRWESAEPMMATTARVDSRLHKGFEEPAKEYYLVSLTGLKLYGLSVEAATEELRTRSALHIAERAVHPRVVRAVDSAGGPFFLLEFPRRLELDGEKTVELRAHLGQSRLFASFAPRKMIFRGRAAL